MFINVLAEVFVATSASRPSMVVADDVFPECRTTTRRAASNCFFFSFFVYIIIFCPRYRVRYLSALLQHTISMSFNLLFLSSSIHSRTSVAFSCNSLEIGLGGA
jgi:hypothetical protein